MSEKESILSFCLTFLSNRDSESCLIESIKSDGTGNFEENLMNKKHFTDGERETEKKTFNRKSSQLFEVKSEGKIFSDLEKIESFDRKNYKCSFETCEKTFEYKWILDRHINSHFCFKLFKCEVETCDKAYKSKENLILHFKNKHLGEKPYQCRFCISRFSHRNGKTYHERKVHINYLPHHCNTTECSLSFASKSALKYHEENQH